MLFMLISMRNPYFWIKCFSNSHIKSSLSALCFPKNWFILQPISKTLTPWRTSVPSCSLCRDQIFAPPGNEPWLQICLCKSERIGKMLFSLWGLKTTTDQREKNRTRPSGSPADESVKSLQRKRQEEMFNCLMSLCSTWAWLWILEAPKVGFFTSVSSA